jgi:hypothetical protein
MHTPAAARRQHAELIERLTIQSNSINPGDTRSFGRSTSGLRLESRTNSQREEREKQAVNQTFAIMHRPTRET